MTHAINTVGLYRASTVSRRRFYLHLFASVFDVEDLELDPAIIDTSSEISSPGLGPCQTTKNPRVISPFNKYLRD